MEKKEIILILGFHKCYTSSLVRVLNSNNNTFIQYEYFHKFYDFFENENTQIDHNMFNCYLDKLYKEQTEQIKNIGDKVICTKFKKLVSFTDYVNNRGVKIIYPIVDVIKWFAKTYSICVRYNNGLKKVLDHDSDVFSFSIITYIKNFIYCFNYDNIIFIKKFETENLKNKLKENLNIDIESNWYEVNQKKSDFISGHVSATHDFVKFDNEIKEKKCDFWDEVLKIFYKYYDNVDAKISNTEIFEDLNKLDKINDKYCITKIEDLYSELIIYEYNNNENCKVNYLK
tara:strand:- start:538 stop:1395 length:858 start_codon:yes stop_codon:yes gene_type:complete